MKSYKTWLPAFSPFTTNISKGYFIRVIKTWDCVGLFWSKDLTQKLAHSYVTHKNVEFWGH